MFLTTLIIRLLRRIKSTKFLRNILLKMLLAMTGFVGCGLHFVVLQPH